MFSTQVTTGGAEIAAPHDFGFQLRHYVIAPQVREGQKLVEIVRLSSGGLVKVDIIREVLRQLYFGGARIPDQQLREFAQTRWGPYQGDAGLYLTADTEAWAKNLGVTLRLRSGALSDPDRP